MISHWLNLPSSFGSPSCKEAVSQTAASSHPLDVPSSAATALTVDKHMSMDHSDTTTPSDSPRTKSDELLSDFDAMRFLAAVDARLKVDRAPLRQHEVDRLEAFYAQACADNCQPLQDIVEHFETEFQRLQRSIGPSGSTLPPTAWV